MKKIIQRVEAPTPPFFRKLRNVGLCLAAAATAILTVPVSLPVLVTSVAGYLAVAGTVATTISQLTTADEGSKKAGKKKEPVKNKG